MPLSACRTLFSTQVVRSTPSAAVRTHLRSPPAFSLHQRRYVSTLILLRHGQSQWNGQDARFTGWSDIPLTVKGRVEAVAAGQLLRSRGFPAARVDVAFTSELQRAHETCELALASMAGPDQHTWSGSRIRRCMQLNERHYGAIQGLRKNDPQLLRTYGNETVRAWRRSFRARPPSMDETHPHYNPPPAPTTESLEDCQKRALACFHSTIAPAMFEEEGLPTPPEDRTVIIVAHSNTIRSLMAAFDAVPENVVPQLHVPNSVPILYRFDLATRQPISTKLQSAAGGSHARWLISAENHRCVRQAVQPGGILTRAVFDALDEDGDRVLTLKELEYGIRELLKDGNDAGVDCVVLAVAKQIAREMPADGFITLEEFETKAAQAYEDLEEPLFSY